MGGTRPHMGGIELTVRSLRAGRRKVCLQPDVSSKGIDGLTAAQPASCLAEGGAVPKGL